MEVRPSTWSMDGEYLVGRKVKRVWEGGGRRLEVRVREVECQLGTSSMLRFLVDSF